MKSALYTAFTALAFALVLALAGPIASPPAHAQEQDDDNVKRILQQGMDGDHYFWQVRCKDGKTTSVVLNDKTTELCAYPLKQPPRCGASTDEWTISEAAVHACQ